MQSTQKYHHEMNARKKAMTEQLKREVEAKRNKRTYIHRKDVDRIDSKGVKLAQIGIIPI